MQRKIAAVTLLPAGYFMKSGLSDLRFFDLLYLNWMENPKIFVKKKKNGRFLPKIAKNGQILAFLTKMSIF